jgi:hypothetical protein
MKHCNEELPEQKGKTAMLALYQHLNHEPQTSRKPLKKKERQCQALF